MTTKQLVMYKFDIFCKLYNLKTSATTKAKNPTQKDFYSNEFIKMDYAPVYGGYRMDIVETGTGERFFDGQSRVSGKEMICYLNGLITAKNKYSFEGIVNES